LRWRGGLLRESLSVEESDGADRHDSKGFHFA
jgi:hypothetical protein